MIRAVASRYKCKEQVLGSAYCRGLSTVHWCIKCAAHLGVMHYRRRICLTALILIFGTTLWTFANLTVLRMSFVCVHADADKRAYQQYFELLLRLVRPGGLIAVDNVLFYGKVNGIIHLWNNMTPQTSLSLVVSDWLIQLGHPAWRCQLLQAPPRAKREKSEQTRLHMAALELWELAQYCSCHCCYRIWTSTSSLQEYFWHEHEMVGHNLLVLLEGSAFACWSFATYGPQMGQLFKFIG